MFIKGMIGGVKVTLATVFTPNDRQDLYHRVCLGSVNHGGAILP